MLFGSIGLSADCVAGWGCTTAPTLASLACSAAKSAWISGFDTTSLLAGGFITFSCDIVEPVVFELGFVSVFAGFTIAEEEVWIVGATGAGLAGVS